MILGALYTVNNKYGVSYNVYSTYLNGREWIKHVIIKPNDVIIPVFVIANNPGAPGISRSISTTASGIIRPTDDVYAYWCIYDKWFLYVRCDMMNEFKCISDE